MFLYFTAYQVVMATTRILGVRFKNSFIISGVHRNRWSPEFHFIQFNDIEPFDCLSISVAIKSE